MSRRVIGVVHKTALVEVEYECRIIGTEYDSHDISIDDIEICDYDIDPDGIRKDIKGEDIIWEE